MFKTNNTNNKTFTQQRAVLKPMKNVAIFEEEEEGQQGFDREEDEDEIYLEDGGSSCHSSGLAVTTHDSRNKTMLLAQFLSTTGPEEYAFNNSKENQTKKQQQFKGASKLLSKLCKRPTMPVLRSSGVPINNYATTGADITGGASAVITGNEMLKKNYIPLPVYEESSFINTINMTTSTASMNNYNKVPTTNIAAAAAAINASNNKTTSTVAPIIKSSTAVATQTTPTNTLKKRHHQQPPLSPIQQQLRDSGIYSETASDKDSNVISTSSQQQQQQQQQHGISISPLPPFLNDLQQFPHPPYHHHKNPRRPAPLPPAIASVAIATARSSTIPTSTVLTVPEAALKRRSVRLRHVQVQTEFLSSSSGDKKEEKHDLVVLVPTNEQQQQPQQEERQACPHCRQTISGSSNNRIRRPSCPPALSSGPFITKMTSEEEEGDNEEGKTDAKALLAMIMKLKSQLAEEKQCRIKLEKAMYQRQSNDRREHLAKEKDRWAGDCLWLNDRIALLPE